MIRSIVCTAALGAATLFASAPSATAAWQDPDQAIRAQLEELHAQLEVLREQRAGVTSSHPSAAALEDQMAQTERILSRPSSLEWSATIGVTLAPVSRRISSAVAFSRSSPRAEIYSSTPSAASAFALPLPSPALPPLTRALRPEIPRSNAGYQVST